MRTSGRWPFCSLIAVLALAAAGSAAPLEAGNALQAAIDAAPAGATVDLGPGVFDGSVVIERPITLRGVGELTVVEGQRAGPTVLIRGDGAVRLELLCVRGGRGWNGYGIEIEGAPGVCLLEVTVRDNAWGGVWATDRCSLSITDCRIVENGTHGLYAWDFARVDVRASEISRNRTHGILAFHLAEIALADSVIDDNLSGIWAWDGTRVRATRTSISGNTLNGVAAQNGALLDLESCTVSQNGQLGLWLTDSGRAVAVDSSFLANGADGVFLEKDGIAELRDCTIAANVGFGIRAATATCMGKFDPHAPYKGWVEGMGNTVAGPTDADPNGGGALCPEYPGSIWPPGFLKQD